MDEHEKPQVSVIIAAYNVAGHIRRAVQSIQAQTVGDWEIVIADDCSTDDTVAVVEELAKGDSRVRLFRQDKNGGPSAARNLAIKSSRGIWVAVLDADDAWRPQRIEKLLEAAAATGSDIVADNFIRYDESIGKEVGPAFREFSGHSEMDAVRYIRSEHPLGTMRYGFLKPMVKLDFLKRHDISYPTKIRFAEDFFFFLTVLLKGGKGTLVGEPLYIYTLPRSLVTNIHSSGSRTVPNLFDRVEIADALLDRYRSRMNERTMRALSEYRSWMLAMYDGQQISKSWKAGNRAASLGRVISRPRSAFYYGLTTPAGKRLRARLASALPGVRDIPEAP